MVQTSREGAGQASMQSRVERKIRIRGAGGWPYIPRCGAWRGAAAEGGMGGVRSATDAGAGGMPGSRAHTETNRDQPTVDGWSRSLAAALFGVWVNRGLTAAAPRNLLPLNGSDQGSVVANGDRPYYFGGQPGCTNRRVGMEWGGRGAL